MLKYKGAVVIVQASWDWPFAVKQMDVYGRTGYAKTIDGSQMVVRMERDETEKKEIAPAPASAV